MASVIPCAVSEKFELLIEGMITATKSRRRIRRPSGRQACARGVSASTSTLYKFHAKLPSGEDHPGLVVHDDDEIDVAMDEFVTAVAAHRHNARQTDRAMV